jgi:hypothetical protein
MATLDEQLKEYEQSIKECELTKDPETNNMIYDLVYSYGYSIKEIKILIFLMGEEQFSNTDIDELNEKLWDIFK